MRQRNPRAPERIAAMRARRPDADVRMIPGAGHWVAYEAPEAVNAMLLEMLAQNAAVTGAGGKETCRMPARSNAAPAR